MAEECRGQWEVGPKESRRWKKKKQHRLRGRWWSICTSPLNSQLWSPAMNILFGKDDAPVIGILGGGQLCMMMVEAAHRMGCKIAVLDPNSACSARSVLSQTDSFVCGSFTSQDDIAKFVEEWYAGLYKTHAGHIFARNFWWSQFTFPFSHLCLWPLI